MVLKGNRAKAFKFSLRAGESSILRVARAPQIDPNSMKTRSKKGFVLPSWRLGALPSWVLVAVWASKLGPWMIQDGPRWSQNGPRWSQDNRRWPMFSYLPRNPVGRMGEVPPPISPNPVEPHRTQREPCWPGGCFPRWLFPLISISIYDILMYIYIYI